MAYVLFIPIANILLLIYLLTADSSQILDSSIV